MTPVANVDAAVCRVRWLITWVPFYRACDLESASVVSQKDRIL